MDQTLDPHRRYLEACRDACARRPLAHTHQLAALERELALCAGAADVGEYLRASADCVELARAATLDRLANQVRVACAQEDRWSAHAALVEYEHALRGAGLDEWPGHLVAGATAAAPHRARSVEALGGFTRTLLNLLHWHASSVSTADHLHEARGSFAALLRADPDFGLRRMREPGGYRQRLPWSDGGLDLLDAWLAEIGAVPGGARDPGCDYPSELGVLEARWRRSLAAAAPRPSRAGAPSFETVLAPYRALARGEAHSDAPAEPVAGAARRALQDVADAATPSDAQRLLVIRGHLAAIAAAPVRARAEQALARQDFWPDPLAAHHWHGLLDSLDLAATPTEVELIVAHADACFAAEADWSLLLTSSALAPLRAAFLAKILGEDARAGVAKAASAAHRLLGLGPRALLALPRVDAFVRRNLAWALANPDAEPGAFAGEAGWEIVTPARAWLAVARAQGAAIPLDPERLPEALAAMLDEAGAPEPQPAPRALRLRDRTVPPTQWDELATAPPRPTIPGFD